MPGRNHIVLGLGCVLLLCAARGDAQEPRRPAMVGGAAEVVSAELSLSRTIELPAVSMAEILGLGAPSAARGSAAAAPVVSAVALGTWSPSARPEGARLTGAAAIRRSVRDAWELRVDSTERRSRHLDVAYALHGADGQAGRLGHPGDASSRIDVLLEPIAPVVVATDGDYDVLRGGVTFHLDLSGVRRAGPHQGTLTVTFHNF